MYRRSRRTREKILFNFDAFLDVIANVNGIIIRLILVAWVGSRAYHGTMTFVAPPPPIDEAITVPALPAPRREDDPLASSLETQRRELAELRVQLAQRASADGDTSESKMVVGQLTSLAQMKEMLAKQSVALADETARELQESQRWALTLDEISKRGQALKTAISQIEAMAPVKKELRYHTPVSKTVTSDEIFFECRYGRVTYLDLPGMMREIEDSFRDKAELLRDRFSVEDVTRPVGAFRLKYTVVRRRDPAEALGGVAQPRDRLSFGYGLGRFEVEPIAAQRGETQEQALRASSEFRQSVDALDSQTVVTFWVYPDSFALFRTLRDYLYEKGIEVAGRPLPDTEPISGSPSGSRSRGQ